MTTHRAIPDGYMTVGEVAKKMNVTVRTLQYYDKEGLLSPSAESEGGRRLYTDKDMVELHQILSLKHVGFSLDEIKNRTVVLNTPEDVANALSEHAAAIREKIERLSESLADIETLRGEVLQMQTVHFKKYADIVANLQQKNDTYWAIKHFDDRLLDHVQNRFVKTGDDLGIMDALDSLQDEAIRLQDAGIPPESEAGQAFARAYWDVVITFTGGDMSLLPSLTKVEQNMDSWTECNTWREKYERTKAYTELALGAYFAKLGHNPFEEVQQ